MQHWKTMQQFIDAFPDHVAILSEDGTLVCVNEAWKKFSRENGGDDQTFYLGQNYLEICRNDSGEEAEIALRIASGLSKVLTERIEYSAEYPCHCSTELRWFKLIAKPVELEGTQYFLVAHHNITTQQLPHLDISRAEQDAKNLSAIVAAMPDALIAFDMEGRITNWNAAAQVLYGYERSEVLGKSLEILYPPDWPMRVKDYLAEVVQDGRRHFDAVRVTKSGKPRTIEVTAAPICSPSGEIIGVSNINRDVTPQRQAHLRTRRILDNLYTFVGVLELDGTLIEANRAPLEAAGLQEEDVFGKKFWKCYWWNYSTDVQTRLEDACKRAAAGETVRYDVRVRVAGEQLIWIDFQIAPLFNDDGEVENLVASGIDISERKATAEALIASHDAFKKIVERSPFGIYTVDSDFRIAHVSKGAEKAFVNVRPLIGHDFAKALHIVWPEPFANEAIQRFRHTLETGEAYHSPRTVEQRHDIEEVEAYDWMIERITMPDGRFGVVCNFYDLSERERYEEHIRLLMREVNHRAKNLLTVVISMARQTAKDVSPQQYVKHFSQRLLGLSASQDLMVEGNWEGVTVESLVRSQLNHLGSNVYDRQIEVNGRDVSITPEAAQGIGMALHELSTNALKYGSLSVASGTVSISWEIDLADDRFHIGWSEFGGPPVAPPENSGFGRTVIEKMAAISVSGEVELDYKEDGLQWKLSAMVSNVIAQPGAGVKQN